MIKVTTMKRERPWREYSAHTVQRLSVGAALSTMRSFDLGSGTFAEEFFAGKLTVSRKGERLLEVARTYEGSSADMAVLLSGLLYGLVQQGRRDYAGDLHALLWEDFQHPVFCYDPDSELLKRNAEKGAVLLAMGVLDSVNVQYVTSGLGSQLDDVQLCAVLDLVRETGMSADQVVTALGNSDK